MTNDFNIEDFEKVLKASNLISTVCELQSRKALKRVLLDKWTAMVLKNQKDDEGLAFIRARRDFIQYLKSAEYLDDKEPLILFLIDTLWYI